MEYSKLVKELVEIQNTLDDIDKKLDKLEKRKCLSYRIKRIITKIF